MQCVRPVKRLRAARYPTREEALSSPGLLERLPERWRKSRQAAAAAGLLAAMAASASGCDKSALGGTPVVTPSAFVQVTLAYAGVPMPTNTMLSEADVYKNIEDAAHAVLPDLSASYKPDGKGKPIEFVTHGKSSGYQIVNTDDSVIDFFDASSGVGFEYLDVLDQADYDIQFTDNNISKLDKDHAYVLVIPSENAADEAGSKEDIQNQVRGFIEWLKAQDII